MKKVLITGGSGNLGKATIEKFLMAQYHVIATTSPGKTLGFEASREVETVSVDAVNEESVNSAVQSILNRHTTIDAAVLLVGSYAAGTIQDTDINAIRKMMMINFESAYLFAQQLFSHMLQQPNGGRIVFIGARPSLEPEAGKDSVAYALSKSLLSRLAEILNVQGASKNVVASVIIPGTIDTPSNRKSLMGSDTAFVTPEEIAQAVEWIVSNSSLREPVLKMYGNS